MTPENFCFWLQGFFEVGKPKSLDAHQTQWVQEHLKLVFKKQHIQFVDASELGKPYSVGPTLPPPLPIGFLKELVHARRHWGDLKPLDRKVLEEFFTGIGQCTLIEALAPYVLAYESERARILEQKISNPQPEQPLTRPQGLGAQPQYPDPQHGANYC